MSFHCALMLVIITVVLVCSVVQRYRDNRCGDMSLSLAVMHVHFFALWSLNTQSCMTRGTSDTLPLAHLVFEGICVVHPLK